MKLSIIIPAYNEEKRIGKTLEDYGSFFNKKYGKEFEIIVSMNHCKDNTIGVVKEHAKKHPQIRYLDFERPGKGYAIMEGFKAAKGDMIGFTDADDATSAEEFGRMIENIGDFDGIMGSRWMKESIVHPKQPLTRRIASRAFNFIIKTLFGMSYQDTQCGAKIFKKETVKSILPKLGITEWAFDIDLLYQAKKRGFKIKEFPITWNDAPGSRLKVGRTSFKMFLAIIRLRLINSNLDIVVKMYDKLPEWIKIHHRLK